MRFPKIAVLVGAFACTGPTPSRDSSAADTSAVSLYHVSNACLPLGRWSVGTIALEDSAKSAVVGLGKPVSVVRDSSEDDGGWYQVSTYRYPGLEFDDVRGVVDRIRATDAQFKTPWGVHAGQSRTAALTALLAHGIAAPASWDTLTVADCGAPGAYLIVTSAHDSVSSIEVATERP